MRGPGTRRRRPAPVVTITQMATILGTTRQALAMALRRARAKRLDVPDAKGVDASFDPGYVHRLRGTPACDANGQANTAAVFYDPQAVRTWWDSRP